MDSFNDVDSVGVQKEPLSKTQNGPKPSMEDKRAGGKLVGRVKEGDYPKDEHPLETAWTVWYDKRDKTNSPLLRDSYSKLLHELDTFSTIEGFYRCFVHLKKPSEIPANYNISIFRRGPRPMWEEFNSGGMWTLRTKHSHSTNSTRWVDKSWERLVVSVIGELFAMPQVVGVVLSTRKDETLLSVWDANDENPAVKCKIGEKMREVLRLPPQTPMAYKTFNEALKDFSSHRNARDYISPMSSISQSKSRKMSAQFDQLPPAEIQLFIEDGSGSEPAVTL